MENRIRQRFHIEVVYEFYILRIQSRWIADFKFFVSHQTNMYLAVYLKCLHRCKTTDVINIHHCRRMDTYAKHRLST